MKVKVSDLSAIKMSVNPPLEVINSGYRVIHEKQVKHWVGIGWVKIHGDWILYDGYMQSLYRMPLVPITDKQIEQISLYGKTCHGDKLYFGLEKQFCSGTRFGFIDKPMIAKLFDLK